MVRYRIKGDRKGELLHKRFFKYTSKQHVITAWCDDTDTPLYYSIDLFANPSLATITSSPPPIEYVQPWIFEEVHRR